MKKLLPLMFVRLSIQVLLTITVIFSMFDTYNTLEGLEKINYLYEGMTNMVVKPIMTLHLVVIVMVLMVVEYIYVSKKLKIIDEEELRYVQSRANV